MSQENLIKELNTLLANLHVLNVKLHNFHWNVSGLQFHAIHEATEAYYDHFFAQFDDVAERILQLGAKPLATTKGLLEAATITEDEGTKFEATYVLEQVYADFVKLLEDVKSANSLAEDAGDLGTADLLGGLITYLEKENWILRSSLGK